MINRLLRWLPALGVTAAVLWAAPTSVASLKLRSCASQDNSFVSATRNVSCKMAIKVDHTADAAHGCGSGRSCKVDGYTCRTRLIGKYSFKETCKRGRRREILIKGGA